MEKKNIAFCISGSLRSLEYCYKNFIDMVYNPNKEFFNIKLFYYIPDDSNKSKIELIKDLNPVVVIEKDITLPKLNILDWGGRPVNCKMDNVSQGGINGYLQQLYGIEKSYKLMSNYENDNNIKFDIILRIRSDVIFKTPLNINMYEMNKIYVPKFHYWDGINDRLAFGPSNLMNIYMKMYSNIYDLANKTKLKLTKAEQFCMINLINNNIPYEMRNEIKFCRIRMNGKVSPDC
tara:strand:+ start:4193 stop:4894 length:702 start_codon:yes stop_codon:yes gene_type:complete